MTTHNNTWLSWPHAGDLNRLIDNLTRECHIMKQQLNTVQAFQNAKDHISQEKTETIKKLTEINTKLTADNQSKDEVIRILISVIQLRHEEQPSLVTLPHNDPFPEEIHDRVVEEQLGGAQAAFDYGFAGSDNLNQQDTMSS